MKKSKAGQATLFQSWGHSAAAQAPANSSSRNANSNRVLQPQNGVYSAFDPNNIVDLGEDDDDDLLAAAEEIAPFNDTANVPTTARQAIASKSILTNHDEVEVIPGFDLEAGNVWIYPTNYPIRNYQYDIVEQALYKNTLVTLPTGLGKTFIAAVVMYNFYRWYPQGKVIFMAPTKPLVAQQIEACFNIMGIPQSDTAEMTGNMAPNKRQSLWQSRRVFFLTPQVLQNDLNRGSCRPEEVVLLVADEAHKALGNHAYCQVVREISGYTRNFRVLALSATPGDDLEAVQQVITNLLISHMELRSEESPDIQPYTHSRKVEKVVVSLGEDISKIKASYLKVLEGVVSRLFCQRALWQRDPQRVTKFLLLSARDQFRKRMNEQGGMDRNQQSRIEADFAMCISLYHAYELLLQHGILSFFNFIKSIMDGTKGMPRAKTEITKNYEFSQLMDELREEIEPPMESNANESLLFSQFSPRRRALMNVPKPSATFKSHPKLMKLKEIVLEHFQTFQDKSGADSKGVTTRVMIFSQYRDSVNEIAALLAQHKPLVRVMSFIGQQSTGKSSRGLSQKEQLQVVQRFRQGGYNTLVATCVGEEGLDIGEVDLIVCFDAHASPIRLVQRMGRTGRKRDGRIVILVTEGKEEQVYQKSQRSKKSIHKAVTQAAKSFDLYTDNPRMVPRQLMPTVLKMEMTVGKFQAQSKGKKKGRSSDGADIKSFATKSATTTSKKTDGFLTYEELVYWQEHFKLPDHEAGLSPQLSVTKRSRRSLSEAKKPVTQPSLVEWLPWQTTLQPVQAVTHSRRTQHLVELLEFTELHGGQGPDGEESYDLEMLSFLNEDDILKPGQRDCAVAEVRVADDDGGCQENEVTRKNVKKAKKTRKKLQMESEAETEDGGKDVSKEHGVGGGKRNVKGTKRRSPENRARWKEYLKRFDNKDEDFESDGTSAGAGPSEDLSVEDELRNRDDAVLESDLPNVGDLHEQTDKTSEVEADKIMLRKGCNEANDEPVMLEGAGRAHESEDGCVSDTASDELSNLLPNATPDFHGFNEGFNLHRARFVSAMDPVPTPPSLDALDKISLSPSSVELDEFPIKPDKESQKSCRNNLRGNVDKFSSSEKALSAMSPKACFGGDSLKEPFLMGDFLEEDDTKAGKELNKENVLKNTCLEKEGRIAETCTVATSETFVSEADEEVIKNQGNRSYNSVSSAHNVDSSVFNQCEVLTSCDVPSGMDNNVPGVPKSGDDDSKVVCPNDEAESGFGFGVWCGSPMNEFNEHVDENCFPQDNPGFAEAFFMDETDDDAFTDLTLPEDVTTENSQQRPVGEQELTTRDRSNSLLCASKTSNERETKAELQSSKVLDKEIKVKPSANSKASAGTDLQASISKLSAFQRSSADRKYSSKLVSDSSEAKGSELSMKSKDGKKIKDCLDEGVLPVDVGQTFPEVASRGEHSSATASDTRVLDDRRNLVAAPPVSFTLPLKQASNKFKLKANRFTETPLVELPSRVKGQEMPEKEPNIIVVPTSGMVTNGNIDTGIRVGHDAVGSASSSTSTNAAGTTASNINSDEKDDVDNICRSPLPKKLKLSRKRTSPKDKGILAKKSEGPQAKPMNFGSTNSLKMNSNEELRVVKLHGTSMNCSSRPNEPMNSETLAREPSSTDMVCDVSLAKDCAANLSNLRTHNGTVVAVMESEDENDREDDEEDVIRPVRKTISLRRQALSSPCSQEGFKRPADKRCENQPHSLSSRIGRLGSESDEEFEVDKSERSRPESSRACPNKPGKEKRKSLGIGGKHGTRKSVDSLRKKNKSKPRRNHFLDDEAELSGSDINDFSSEEEEEENVEELDSFIDDSTQMTQRTPSAARPRHASSPMDMMAVYRQSLRSPLCGSLNFKTPLFHKQRNRYKMVYKAVDEGSESPSEAEETYGSDSVFENEVEDEDEIDGYRHDSLHENEADTHAENEVTRRPQSEGDSRVGKSFEESQIGRPVKRMKRKRILDDTVEEEVSPKLSKHSKMPETYDKENTVELGPPLKPPPPPQRQTNAFGNFPAKSKITGNKLNNGFVKSTDVLADKGNFLDNNTSLQRSASNKESMRNTGSFVSEWNNDISDSELLNALECEGENSSIKKTPGNNIFQYQDMKEIAVAMEMTDDDVVMELNDLPTFSLGFDFLSETFLTDNASTGDWDSSKINSVTLTERQSESCENTIKYSFSNEFSNERNPCTASNRTLSSSNKDDGISRKAEKFTKIVQSSKHSLESSYQVPDNNPQTENKISEKPVLGKVSQSTRVAPQNVVKPIISNSSSLTSNHRPGSKNLSTTDTHNAQRPVSEAHAKLQVVTPSCRPTPLGTRPANSPLLTSSDKDKGKTIILVDTREISSSQVVSLLRLKHNMKAEVCQLTGCDYIVSNRMAVKRKTASDVANGANSPKLVECMRRMCDLYDRPCLIIEKDRVRPGETEKKLVKTKAYIFTLACIAQTHVKILFSDSHEQTATLLAELAAIETKKGTTITAPTSLSKEREQVFRVVLSFPHVSYITALNLCSSFKTLHEIISSTAPELERRTPSLSRPRAAEIYKYLRHKFNPEMVASKK